MRRYSLAHARGDAISAVLAAVGYNFHLPFRRAKSKLFRRTGIAASLCAASRPA